MSQLMSTAAVCKQTSLVLTARPHRPRALLDEEGREGEIVWKILLIDIKYLNFLSPEQRSPYSQSRDSLTFLATEAAPPVFLRPMPRCNIAFTADGCAQYLKFGTKRLCR
jgi:hypothetical protein